MTDTATTRTNDACDNHVCSSADEMTFARGDVVSGTAARGRRWQRHKCPTLCRLQSGSQPMRSPIPTNIYITINVIIICEAHITTIQHKSILFNGTQLSSEE